MTFLESRFLLLYGWVAENKASLFRFLAIPGVLLAGAVLIPRLFSGSRYPALLMAAFILLVLMIGLLRWPILGLISIFLGGMFVPIVGPSGTNAAVGAVALMLALWLLKMMMEERQIRLISSGATIPVYVFIVISIFAFLIGQLPWYVNAPHAPLDTQLGGLAIFILSAGAFLLVAHLAIDLRKLQWMVWVFIMAGAIYVLGRLLPGGISDRIYHNGFTSGSMFWTWLVALTFAQAVFNNGLRMRWRILLGVLVAATMYVAYVQAYTWKSGWLPPLVAIAAIIAFRYWKPAFILVPIAVILVPYLANMLIGTEGEAYSYGTRMDAWIIVLNIARANPLLGLGFGNYYWITPLFPIRGYEISFNSHSQYVDLLAQTGLIGLACFLWIFWASGRLGWRLRETVPGGFPRAYVYGALGGIAGTLVACTLVDWVLPFVYNIGFNGFRASILVWMFLGGLVSLEQMVRVRS